MEEKAVKSTLQDDNLAFAAAALWPHELPLQGKVRALLMLPSTLKYHKHLGGGIRTEVLQGILLLCFYLPTCHV